MKKSLIALLIAIALGSSIFPTVTRSGTLPSKGSLSRIYGKIQYVDSCADYTVEDVASAENLSVQEVSCCPSRPGEWQIVTSAPDFRIQKVTSAADFTIRYVGSCPGVN